MKFTKKQMDLGNKIASLKGEDIKVINRFLKMMDCETRIAFTDIHHAKKAFKGLKNAFDKI